MDFLPSVADTTPFAVQAEVTLQTNFFATRDMLTHFLPMVKAGGTDAEPNAVVGIYGSLFWSEFQFKESAFKRLLKTVAVPARVGPS